MCVPKNVSPVLLAGVVYFSNTQIADLKRQEAKKVYRLL